MVARAIKKKAAICAAGVAVATSLHFLALDGLPGLLLAAVYCLDQDTEYAPQYEECKFRQIRVGFSKGQVEALVGRPLDTRTYGQEDVWYYTQSPGDTHYFIRAVVFSSDGVVTRVAHEFYVD